MPLKRICTRRESDYRESGYIQVAYSLFYEWILCLHRYTLMRVNKNTHNFCFNEITIVTTIAVGTIEKAIVCNRNITAIVDIQIFSCGVFTSGRDWIIFYFTLNLLKHLTLWLDVRLNKTMDKWDLHARILSALYCWSLFFRSIP